MALVQLNAAVAGRLRSLRAYDLRLESAVPGFIGQLLGFTQALGTQFLLAVLVQTVEGTVFQWGVLLGSGRS